MRSQVHDSKIWFVALICSDKKEIMSLSLNSLGHLTEDLLELVEDDS